MAKHWQIGTLISAALHGGVAAAVLVSAPRSSGVRPEPVPAITVEMFRPGDLAADGAPVAAGAADVPAVSTDPPKPDASPSSGTAAPSGESSPESGGAPAAGAPDPGVLSDYYRRLEGHLARFHKYPLLGGRRPEGQTRVGLIVNRRGDVLDAWVESSSGSRELDEAALLTVRRSEPLPPLPGDLPASIDLIVPLKFDSGARAAS